MAKWLKDYLSFGSRRSPPQPPKPDYTESEILKAYRAQKSLDFEDPYEDGDGKPDPDPEGSPNKVVAASGNSEGKYGSPKHRLIKVDSSDLNRSKALLATAPEEGIVPPDQALADPWLSCPYPAVVLTGSVNILITHSKLGADYLADGSGGLDAGPDWLFSEFAQPLGESEYSDPFDAHREPKEDGEEDVELENNGYMEPYDAQKVVVAPKLFHLGSSDLQRKNDKEERKVKKSRKGLQLYDTPYEEKEPEASLEGSSADKPRESRLPQDDERPADEYDQPWEWKKNHISRAFAGEDLACLFPGASSI
ncbi:UNVERIFIED_CONTAM: hypothetical protein K2H54_023190 [Gekko kuhli]